MDSSVTVKYKNSKGRELVLSRAWPFVLESVSGFGMPENAITSTKLYGLDGEVKLMSSLNSRLLQVNGVIFAETYEELQTAKIDSISILNPRLSGTLSIEQHDKRYEIDVELIKGIDEGDDNGTTWQQLVLQFNALDPYWRNVSDYHTDINLSTRVDEWEFPLDIEDGFEFATVDTGIITTIVNDGDTDTGAIYTMTFGKTVTNPKIYNVLTQEFMGMKGDYSAGDKIVISTMRDNFFIKYYISMFGGAEVNGMPYRTIGSSFMQLKQGYNSLQVQADSGVDGLFVSVKFTPLVLGV
ncbi:MAG: phage tail family protein [Lactobacillaceae bacterium]|jgi:hypothetical protein|nr:phage tail family protein [Lactobacillaceae bacterium]